MMQLVIASRQLVEPLGPNWSQFATSSDVVRSRFGALTSYRFRGGTLDMKGTRSSEPLEPLIFTIRGHRVLLDADLARVYGVSTKAFNQAFKRNQHRFPADFAFRLTEAEFTDLRSQFVTSNLQPADLAGRNWSQTVTSSEKAAASGSANSSQFVMSSMSRRGKTYRPWAFTEHGALMAANILRSERAFQMSVFVVRAFIRLREQLATNTEVVARLADIEKTLLRHDQDLLDLYLKLQALLEPPPDPPKRAIGFHPDER